MKPITLSNKNQIQTLFKQGRKVANYPLKAFFRPNDLQQNRYLFCPDKTCKNSVQRNRVKRILRVLCSEKQQQATGLDIAIISNYQLSDFSMQKREQIFHKLFQRIIYDK